MTMTATTQPVQITDDERARRRAARDRLKAEVKKPDANGSRATVLCMMISHARGKLHCPSYLRYHGGWRADQDASKRVKVMEAAGCFESDAFQRYAKRLGPGCEERWARYLYAKSMIESLDDQRAFLRKFLKEEAQRIEVFERVMAAGRRPPYDWETPCFDEELREICEHIVSG